MSQFVRDSQGIERCQTVVEKSIPNSPQDPSAGFHAIKSLCNKPATHNLTENRKMCPDCDKQPPVGWVKPKITNAAGVVLTKKELEECGVKDGKDPSLVVVPAKSVRKAERKFREPKKAMEAKVKKEVRKDVVVLEVPLTDLEGGDDVAAMLIAKTIAAFGLLPVTNYAESKRLMVLEEKLKTLLGA